MGPDRNNVPCRPDDISTHSSDESSSEGHESSEEMETPDKIESVPWTTIQRKRAHNLDSLKNKGNSPRNRPRLLKIVIVAGRGRGFCGFLGFLWVVGLQQVNIN